MAKAPKKDAKKPRKPRAKKPDPSKPAPQVAGSNSVDRDKQRLAVVHRDAYIRRKAAVSKANRDMAALKKLIKGDNFTVKQITIMADLQTPEGEAAVKLSVAQTLEAARWASNPLGAQLEMFMEPDRTPAVDQAREDGIRAAMEGKSLKPPYDPSTPQYSAFAEAWHGEQERMMKKGLKKLGEDTEKELQSDRASTMKANRDDETEAGTKH